MSPKKEDLDQLSPEVEAAIEEILDQISRDGKHPLAGSPQKSPANSDPYIPENASKYLADKEEPIGEETEGKLIIEVLEVVLPKNEVTASVDLKKSDKLSLDFSISIIGFNLGASGSIKVESGFHIDTKKDGFLLRLIVPVIWQSYKLKETAEPIIFNKIKRILSSPIEFDLIEPRSQISEYEYTTFNLKNSPHNLKIVKSIEITGSSKVGYGLDDKNNQIKLDASIKFDNSLTFSVETVLPPGEKYAYAVDYFRRKFIISQI